MIAHHEQHKQMTELALTRRQRDFLRLNIYVQMQHGFIDRAASLAECLNLIGDDSTEALLAKAVTAFAQKRWDDTLNSLEKLKHKAIPQEDPDLKLCLYLEIRCHYERGDLAAADQEIKRYLDRQ